MSTNTLEFGVAVGICRNEGVGCEQVYLHLADLGSVSIDTDTARQVAMNLLMTADFLEKRVIIHADE